MSNNNDKSVFNSKDTVAAGGENKPPSSPVNSDNTNKRTYKKPLLKKYGPLNRLTLFTSG